MAVKRWPQLDDIKRIQQSLNLSRLWFIEYIYIYRNITYIFYLFLFVKMLKGLPFVLPRAWPCPPPTNWQGLEMEALLSD